MSVALKAAGHLGVSTPRYLGLFWIFSGSGFATPRYIGHRGVLTHKVLRSLYFPVHRTPGSHFKMLITQPRNKKNQNGPRTSLMGPGGVVWGKKPSTKNLVRLSL